MYAGRAIAQLINVRTKDGTDTDARSCTAGIDNFTTVSSATFTRGWAAVHSGGQYLV